MKKNNIINLENYDDCNHILNSDNFRVDHPLRGTRQIFGPTVLDTEGDSHHRKKKQWLQHFRPGQVKLAFAGIISDSVNGGFHYAESSRNLYDACTYIPNRVVLSILGWDNVDPMAHYEKIRAIAIFLETGVYNEYVENAKSYINNTVSNNNANLFDVVDREAEVSLFLLAGIETTVIALKILMVYWIENNITLQKLVHQDGIEKAIIRILKQDPPLGIVTRFCAKSTIVGDNLIERGDIVHANIAQKQNFTANFGKHIASYNLLFGSGNHHCPGNHLAMLEMHTFLSILLTQNPGDYVVSKDGQSERPRTFRHPNDYYIRPKSP